MRFGIIFNECNGMLANGFRECIVRRAANVAMWLWEEHLSRNQVLRSLQAGSSYGIQLSECSPTEYSSVNAVLQNTA